jgi:hypothetical protein
MNCLSAIEDELSIMNRRSIFDTLFSLAGVTIRGGPASPPPPPSICAEPAFPPAPAMPVAPPGEPGLVVSFPPQPPMAKVAAAKNPAMVFMTPVAAGFASR